MAMAFIRFQDGHESQKEFEGVALDYIPEYDAWEIAKVGDEGDFNKMVVPSDKVFIIREDDDTAV